MANSGENSSSGKRPRPRPDEGGRPLLLIGAGQRPRELGAVLSALGAMRARMDGDAGAEPQRPMGLGDLEELLTRLPPQGTLVLDYGRVPGEDIGFVRRFLERHGEWRLVLVGEDVGDRRARSLLALPRTQWLPWPPDLDQINALLPTATAASQPGSETTRPAKRTKRPRDRGPRPAGGDEPVDVGNLLEELLVGASLEGGATPRYLYRCDRSLFLQRDPGVLQECFGALLQLARACAGAEGVVSARVDPLEADGEPRDALQVRIDFPGGELAAEDWPAQLERPPAGEGTLAQALQAASRAAERLRAMGGRVLARAGEPERLRLEVQLASEELSAPAAAPARRAKAEDPFA